MKTGAELIAEERKRQIEVEGWTEEHDKQHTVGELALVAALYATPIPLFAINNRESGFIVYDPWPWYEVKENTRYGDGSTYKVKAWDKRKKHSRMRCLVIAGALIAAEIDRMQRHKQEATL